MPIEPQLIPLQGPDSIDPPSHCGGQEDRGEVNIDAFVVARCDPAKILEAAEHTLDRVPRLIGHEVIRRTMLSGRIGRDHGFAAAFDKPFAQFLSVVRAVGYQPLRDRYQAQQVGGTNQIMGVAGGHDKGSRPTSGVC
jgi:hypothetical protein